MLIGTEYTSATLREQRDDLVRQTRFVGCEDTLSDGRPALPRDIERGCHVREGDPGVDRRMDRNSFRPRDWTSCVSAPERVKRQLTAPGNGNEQCQNVGGDVSRPDRTTPNHSRELEPVATTRHSHARRLIKPLVSVGAYVRIEALWIRETSSLETLGDLEPLGCCRQAEIDPVARYGRSGRPIAVQIGDDARDALARHSPRGRPVGKQRASSIMSPVEPTSKRAMSAACPGVQRLLASDHGETQTMALQPIGDAAPVASLEGSTKQHQEPFTFLVGSQRSSIQETGLDFVEHSRGRQAGCTRHWQRARPPTRKVVPFVRMSPSSRSAALPGLLQDRPSPVVPAWRSSVPGHGQRRQGPRNSFGLRSPDG